MSRTVNVWIAMSDAGLTEFREYRQSERDDTIYTGPMTEQAYKGLERMADTDTVQRLFANPDIGGKGYNLFSLYFDLDRLSATAVQDFFNYMTTEWPSDFIIVGAWWMDGRQVGTQWADEDQTSTTGTPMYAIHPQAFRLMPDVVEYDENGDVVSTTPPSSNADLRDINVRSGQRPRRFT